MPPDTKSGSPPPERSVRRRWGLGQLAALALLGWFGGGLQGASPAAQEPSRPNIVVILIDDLNDWVGCLGGNPQAKTPHIDRLARRGTLFANAHVQATFCTPSRVSLLSGLQPMTTGVYELLQRYNETEALRDRPPFPLWLRRAGYATHGGGKIFHEGTGLGWLTESWDTVLATDENPAPPVAYHMPSRRIWDWGPWPDQDEQMGDFQLARKAAEMMRRKHDRPQLVVAGFHRPHVPLHVPAKWFDLYPLDQIALPLAPPDDLDDVPHPEIALNNHLAPPPAWLKERNLTHSLVQAYLAAISFVDHCVGEIVRGIEEGPNAGNTVVILASDHGFHLGEKQHWAKRTLWEETTRVPLIVAGPGIPAGLVSRVPAGLIDLYPTICELAGVPVPDGLEGRSLSPLWSGTEGEKAERFALTTERAQGALHHSLRSRDWRYIRYADGQEELYDHRRDPHEWTNLAKDADHAPILQHHREALASLLGQPR
jgi:choline-sulfatase